eukprot:7558608-Alexandrium_andersonii.AAC.1
MLHTSTRKRIAHLALPILELSKGSLGHPTEPAPQGWRGSLVVLEGPAKLRPETPGRVLILCTGLADERNQLAEAPVGTEEPAQLWGGPIPRLGIHWGNIRHEPGAWKLPTPSGAGATRAIRASS